VLQRQRHLKWAALDRLEQCLMVICGATLFGFSTSVICDIVTRTIGHPWLWLQEVTSTFFVYGIFIGAAATTRPKHHFDPTPVSEALHGSARRMVETVMRLVVIAVALWMIYFGHVNFLRGFGSFRMPSMTPIASLYAAIPLSGVLIALFAVEQLVNGWRNGFDHPDELIDPQAEVPELLERTGGAA